MEFREGKDEGLDCLVVRTALAEYYYQKDTGGFSSLHDIDGVDWINFKSTSYGFPGDAGGVFRGIPNAVFPGNIGHPGHTHMRSEQISENALRSTSLDGAWAWTWTFAESWARLDVEEAPSDVPYWFLYEGTPGGRFAPANSFWGTDATGPRNDAPDYMAKEGPFAEGSWKWAYVGLSGVPRALCLASLGPEGHPSMFAYLGSTEAGLDSPDGMTVFGFGRRWRSKAAIVGPRGFAMGFVESDDHETIAWAARIMSGSEAQR